MRIRNARNLPLGEFRERFAADVVRASGDLAPEIAKPFKEKAEQHFAASTYHNFYADGSHLNALGNHVLAGLVLEHLGLFGN